MRTHRKPPELLEAQVGSFFLDVYEGNRKGARRNLARKTQRLLELDMSDVSRTDEQLPHKHYPKYLDYLGSADHELLDAQAQAITRYHEVFEPAIQAHYAELDHHEPMSKGGASDAFHLSVDGVDYVVRRERSGALSEIHKHFLASLRVQDIEGLEHIEAISWQDAITVAPRLPGKTIDKLDEQEIEAITPEQLSAFYETLQQGNARGVNFDGTPGNILYDPERGFSAIDFSLMPTGSGGGADETLLCIAVGLAAEWKTFHRHPASYAAKLPELYQTIEAIISADHISAETVAISKTILDSLLQKDNPLTD
ncbi:MAG: hypothetical protein WBP12_04765 [Candidatus Saccharimonas sp.]